ncbi:dTMP kinase [Nisaea acidiphila]|uniref:Thymidylate kinase n=1 Tax=Nisaea acidiphila TaxID=1862145 RepID=A0A9J7B0W1_9PROT|nr:dTMP kinase [Nisaea acidiphila]
MPDRARGRFITFEGGEGAGKSTQIRKLSASLEAAGIEVCLTREPGGSPGAEQIRELLVTGETGRWDAITELLLLYAARRDHVQRLIEPALARGCWVLCDRFADSTMAYQGYGHGLDLQKITDLHRIVLGELKPDLTLVLDLAPETGLARTRAGEEAARRGGEDRFERMELAFHERMREGFHAIASSEPDRVVLIDAGKPLEKVQDAVATAVRERLKVRL